MLVCRDTRATKDSIGRSRGCDAINYARMVIRYVNDGSGTHDMITKAIDKLNQNYGVFLNLLIPNLSRISYGFSQYFRHTRPEYENVRS